MEKERKLFICVIVVFLLFSFNLSAQGKQAESHDLTISIPDVALLDLESSNTTSIILSPESPTTAGLALDFSNIRNNDIWINYSSIVGGSTEPSRIVTVAVSSTVPDGLLLKVSASSDAGKGGGTVGTPLGTVNLTTEPQNLITGIGSCYTGDGVTKGHRLSYSLELKDADSYADLDYNQSKEITVTYTLTDNN